MLDMEKLKELHDNGSISEQEFIEQKQRLYRRVDRFDGNAPAAKNGIIYILLGWFLGTIGLHNFYAGYIWRGVCQLVLTATSWLFLFIPLLFTALWAFLEVMLVNYGANGLFFKGDRRIIWALRLGAIVWLSAAFYYSNLATADMQAEFCNSLIGAQTENLPVE